MTDEEIEREMDEKLREIADLTNPRPGLTTVEDAQRRWQEEEDRKHEWILNEIFGDSDS